MVDAEEKPGARTSSVAFNIDESSRKKTPGLARRLSKRNSLRSSFLSLKRLSFRRSGGQRGADINTLRGNKGPDFEGYATITRSSGSSISCNCIGGGDDSKEKVILIKGAYCFVFVKENDSAPKYALACAHMKAKMQSSSHGIHHVTIETHLGDVEWELGFAENTVAKHFVDAFRQQAAVGEADEVRRRLGHERLLEKRSSIKYAESVAVKKLEEQPEKKENVLLEDVNQLEPMISAC